MSKVASADESVAIDLDRAVGCIETFETIGFSRDESIRKVVESELAE